MTETPHPQKRLLFAVGLHSASLIAFQLVLMQILSIVQWHHFAYMVISIALLGFGASGTLIFLFRKTLLKQSDIVVPVSMFLTAMFMTLSVFLSQTSFFRFDSYLLFADYSHIRRLVFTYLLFFLPFLTGALAIGVIFVKHVDQISKLYFANLTGSGLGGILAVLLMWLLFPQKLPAVISILPLISGLILLSNKARSVQAGLSFLSFLCIVLFFVSPPALKLSEFKSLNKTLNIPDTKIGYEKSSPYGLIQSVSSPILRYVPGLSLNYTGEVPGNTFLFNNGNFLGAFPLKNSTDSMNILNYTTCAIPFVTGNPESALIPNGSSGTELILAVSQGIGQITVIEPNEPVLSLLKNELAEETGSLLNHPSVTIHSMEPRTFFASDSDKYDLILMPVTGAFGGASGLNAVQEQYLLTTEAVCGMLEMLTSRGMISITTWLDYPVRRPLKLLATFIEALKQTGINNPSEHIAGIRNWNALTLIIKKNPVSLDESQRIIEFCEEMSFDPVWLPGIELKDREIYNILDDGSFQNYVDTILSGEAENFYREYNFNIKPASDGQPYFSRFIRLRSLPDLRQAFGDNSLPFFELGYLIVGITFIQVLAAALVLIMLPLLTFSMPKGNRTRILFYFGGIGLGYMFMEIVLIQKFILYVGNPIYSAASVISSLLIWSGAGSYYSSRLKLNQRTISMIFIVIILSLILYITLLSVILKSTISTTLSAKLLLIFLLTGLPAFFMGIPFPAGLKIISKIDENAVPWAWGINGCFSVVSTVLATIIAVELGFSAVMIFAVSAYVVSLVSFINVHKADVL